MTINERKSLPLWKKLIIFVVSFILFLIQLATFGAVVYLFYSMSSNAYQGILGILFGISYGVGIVYVLFIVSRPISTSYKTTWAILIMAAPLPFCVLYTTNSLVRYFSRKKHEKINKELEEHYRDTIGITYEFDNTLDANFTNVLSKETYAPIYEGCNLKFFPDAKLKHESMLEDLRCAKSYILMEYFIISSGKCFDAIYEILKEKGKEGVKTYILYDDVGSKGFSKKEVENKLAVLPNVSVCKFHPVSLSLSPTINYRDHRKICVVDGKVAYCGGDNLADEYIHEVERFGYWRDNAFRYEGEVVDSFVKMFCNMWYSTTRELLNFEKPILSHERQKGYVVAFGDGPANVENTGYDLFYSLINSARKYVYISTPYFIIDDALIQTMCIKAKSGVEVCLLMPGIPDKKAPNYMGRANYRKLLLSNVKIYEFSPGFNHAKNIIVDDEYAFCGTINMDYRSLFLHYECGAIIMDNPEIYKMRNDFIKTLSKSEQVLKEEWEKRPLIQKIIAFILNIIAPFF